MITIYDGSKHREDVINILEKYIKVYYNECMDWFRSIEKHLSLSDNRHAQVYIKDDKVCGLIILKEKTEGLKISTLIVDEDYRHQGIGTNLINNTLDLFPNFDEIYIRTKNSEVVSFLKKFKFNIKDIKKEEMTLVYKGR